MAYEAKCLSIWLHKGKVFKWKDKTEANAYSYFEAFMCDTVSTLLSVFCIVSYN